MAAGFAWVLNLDAEYELGDPRGYTPSRATLQRVRAQAARIQGLLGADDVWVDDGACEMQTQAAVGPQLRGAAWCPTPRALARLRAAGATLPQAPPLEVLQRVNHRAFCAELFPGPLGTVYVRDAEVALAALARPSPSGRWVAKRAFGLAGQGQRRFGPAPAVLEASGVDAPVELDVLDQQWVRRCFKLGHGVVLEPWVVREGDFGIHGVVSRAGEVVLGRALAQECDARGMWQRSIAIAGDQLREQEAQSLRAAALESAAALHAAGYFGPFGIDAFRYRDAAGQLRFNPRVEINARYCMGWGLSGLPAPCEV